LQKMYWARRIVNCSWRFRPEPFASSKSRRSNDSGRALTAAAQGTHLAPWRVQLFACEPQDLKITRLPAEEVERSKTNVNEEVNPEDHAGKLRPAKGQDQVVNIAPVVFRHVELNKFAVSGSDRDWSRGFFHETSFCLSIHLPPPELQSKTLVAEVQIVDRCIATPLGKSMTTRSLARPFSIIRGGSGAEAESYGIITGCQSEVGNALFVCSSPQRSDLKAARSSCVRSSGSSHAAKCPPLSSLL
jgi:hypothetical protein